MPSARGLIVGPGDRVKKENLPTDVAYTGDLVGLGVSAEVEQRLTEVEDAVGAAAPLVSPHFADVPTAPTAADGTSSEQLATTEFVELRALSVIGATMPAPYVGYSAPTDGSLWWAEPYSAAADTDVPTAPTIGTLTVAANNDISVPWTGGTDASGIAYWRVLRGVGSGSTPTLYKGIVTANPFVDTMLDANETYRYQVQGVDPFGQIGALSSIAEITTGDATLAADNALLVAFYMETALTALTAGAAVQTIAPQFGAWKDQVSLTQSVVGNRPTVASVTLNGTKKVLRLAAASLQYIQGLTPTRLDGARTVLVVAKVAPQGGSRHIVTGIQQATYWGVGVNASNKPTAIAAPSQSLPSGTSVDSTYRVIVVTTDADGNTEVWDHRKSSPATGQFDVDAGNAMESIRFGRNAGSSSSYFGGDIVALAVFSGVLSDARIGDYADEMQVRYGLPAVAA